MARTLVIHYAIVSPNLLIDQLNTLVIEKSLNSGTQQFRPLSL